MRRRWLAVAASLLVVLLLAVDLRLQPGGEHATRTVDDLTELFAAAAAGIAALVRAARSRGRVRASWALLGAGACCWSLGQTIWSYYELVAGRETPFPSLADAGYLLFPVLALLGLLARPSRAFAGQGRLRVGLDGLLVAASLFTISWATTMGQVYAAGGSSSFAAAVGLAYPGSDVILLTVAVVVLTYARSGSRAGLGLIGAGLVGLAIADSGFAYLTATGAYATGNLIDAGWVGGFLILAVAAVLDRPASEPESGEAALTPRTALLLPYLPAVAGVTTVLWRVHDHHADAVSFVAATVMLCVLVARHVVVLLDNRGLMARVTHQAFHDVLTGLANRALFDDRLGHALDLHRRDLRPVTVLLVDLDDFKVVNDTHGHHAGDELLVRVSERLLATVRTGDTVARFGGDEFAILVEDGGHPIDVAARVLGCLDQPVLLGGQQMHVAASIGVAALGPQDAPVNGSEMLKRADTAMYAAKRAGKGTVASWSPELAGESEPTADLRTALADDLLHGRLEAAYQPIHLADGTLTGFEALARWRHDGVPVSPATFLPMARRLGRLPELDRAVLELAVTQAATWPETVGLSVNVDGETLLDPAFPDHVVVTLRRHGVAPGRLAVEVLESNAVEQEANALRSIERLRALGVRVSVDDFGAGYASLARLHALRPHVIKIDRSLVAAELGDGGASPLLSGVTELAHRIGAVVVAEGVETARQLEAALAAGCDAVQGFLWGRPTDAEGARRLLATRAGQDGVTTRR